MLTPEAIAVDFPPITASDVLEALTFAAEALREREIPLSISA